MIKLTGTNPDIVDTVFGTVYPPMAVPSGTGFDAREHALRTLRRFIALLAFERRMPPPESSQRFQIPFRDIHVYQPDDIADVHMPAIGMRPGRGKHEAVRLGPAEIDESTIDVFGQGTALIQRSEYVEQIGLEVLASKHPYRVAVMAGLKEALTMWESSYALRLRMPDYYDQIAEFALDESEYVDDDQVFRNRRRADLYVTLRVPEVSLVRYALFRPEVILTVNSGNTTGVAALADDDWP